MTITRADWLPDVLRDARCPVKTHGGWVTRGRDFTDLCAVVWHHDASPSGDSPGVPAYMLREQAAGRAWAQLWVDRTGGWHVLGSGVAFHAGRVLAGMPSNGNSLGVETDHTTGETWPACQLDSLRRGSAAIIARLGRTEAALHFHKSICDPPGRKSDPDGLALTPERARISVLLSRTDHAALTTPPTPDSPRGPSMVIVKDPASNAQWLVHMGRKWRINTTPELAAYAKACPRVDLDAIAYSRLVEA